MQIQLKQPHQHAGKQHLAGDTLEVDDAIGAWMITNKIATEMPPAVLRPKSRTPQTTQEENE